MHLQVYCTYAHPQMMVEATSFTDELNGLNNFLSAKQSTPCKN